mgnify:CR=1 FL=1
MKTTYKLADGKTVEIEVSAELAATLADFNRKEQNEARKYRRRKEVSIEALKDETGWEPIDTAADIATVLIADEEKATLLAAVSRLSDKQRRLVNLRYYEEKTEYEIAAILGINQSNVHRQLNTIHNALKKVLEKFDY